MSSVSQSPKRDSNKRSAAEKKRLYFTARFKPVSSSEIGQAVRFHDLTQAQKKISHPFLRIHFLKSLILQLAGHLKVTHLGIKDNICKLCSYATPCLPISSAVRDSNIDDTPLVEHKTKGRNICLVAPMALFFSLRVLVCLLPACYDYLFFLSFIQSIRSSCWLSSSGVSHLGVFLASDISARMAIDGTGHQKYVI